MKNNIVRDLSTKAIKLKSCVILPTWIWVSNLLQEQVALVTKWSRIRCMLTFSVQKCLVSRLFANYVKAAAQTVAFTLAVLFSQSSIAELEPKAIQDAYKTSYQYEKAENYQDAIKAIGVISIHYPKTYTVNLRLGYLYYRHGQYANALQHYKTAHEALPNAISPLLGKMSVGIATKSYDDVEQSGFLILKKDLYNYYANLKLGYVLTESKKIDAAETIILRMLDHYPEDVAFLTQFAKLMVIKKEFDRAATVYGNILVLDPENVAANYYFSSLKEK